MSIPCLNPRVGWKSKDDLRKENGALYTSINYTRTTPIPYEYPCGSCLPCLGTKARDWWIRLEHEYKFPSDNMEPRLGCALTLTYDQDHLPDNGELNYAHVQKFLKRVRFHISKTTDKKIKFFVAGEYGPKTHRPHYHMILLGADFSQLPDAIQITYEGKKRNKSNQWISKTVDKLWKKGQVNIGEFNSKSAKYVCGYVTGKENDLLKLGIEEDIEPPFRKMSSHPAMGTGYYEKFKDEILQNGNIIMNGKPQQVPRYYSNKLKKDFPEEYELYKQQKAEAASKIGDAIDPDRRARLREFAEYQRNQVLKGNQL